MLQSLMLFIMTLKYLSNDRDVRKPFEDDRKVASLHKCMKRVSQNGSRDGGQLQDIRLHQVKLSYSSSKTSMSLNLPKVFRMTINGGGSETMPVSS